MSEYIVRETGYPGTLNQEIVGELVRCRDCKWWNDIGCAVKIVDDSDKPKAEDFCSFGEKKERMMPRLIDANELMKNIPSEEYCSRLAVANAPTVDAVEVVRCRDCKHYQLTANNWVFGWPVKRCEITGFEDVDDFDFCSRGERRE